MGGAGWRKQYKLALGMQESSGRDGRSFGGCGYCSVVEDLPVMHEALGLILNITKSKLLGNLDSASCCPSAWRG